MQTPLVLFEMSQVKRCPHFGSFKYISGMPLRTCAVECYKSAFQSSLCSRDLLCCTLARNANRRLVICITVRNVHALNQSSAPENLVREACQCLHYLLNFHTVQVLTCVARDCKSVLSNGIARCMSCPHLEVSLSIYCTSIGSR